MHQKTAAPTMTKKVIKKVPPVRHDVSRLSRDDLFLFNEGSHFRLYDKLGAHVMTADDGCEGTFFAVWAPSAQAVSVIGDFNDWNKNTHPLKLRGASGIWEGFVRDVGKGIRYKFHIQTRQRGYKVEKTDPYGFFHEISPDNASVVWPLDYTWQDKEWMQARKYHSDQQAAISIYELHLGSWKQRNENGNRSPNYRELAGELAGYIQNMGFTHVEFLPVMEHPFYGSWGYQCTGYFAPTSRYGSPQDFMYLIDYLHQHQIGVILDWVPAHFPNDAHGLGFFDGTHLYEHPDPQRGINPEWNSYMFNYERAEVQSFLFSSAFFWADKYHADGFRLDAVSSMLYLDYARRAGEWIPNRFGGNENIQAIEFLRRFNREIYAQYPDIQTYAEEATAWPMVSRPTYLGGLGFGYKWDMGWMNDTLAYFSQDPVFRKYHHHKITFRSIYAFNENYILPLSHDEVVHGKSSLLGRMPGDDWQKFANLRVLFGNHYAQPGKKLLFMGGEIGQWNEWSHERFLDWNLLDFPMHQGLQRWVQDLNRLYRQEKTMHELDNHTDGFEWVDCLDNENSVISFLRKDLSGEELMLVVFNLTPAVRENYRLGVPFSGFWQERLNSDAQIYGGSGKGNMGGLDTASNPSHHHPCSLMMILPPLSCLFFKFTHTG